MSNYYRFVLNKEGTIPSLFESEKHNIVASDYHITIHLSWLTSLSLKLHKDFILTLGTSNNALFLCQTFIEDLINSVGFWQGISWLSIEQPNYLLIKLRCNILLEAYLQMQPTIRSRIAALLLIELFNLLLLIRLLITTMLGVKKASSSFCTCQMSDW